MSTAVAEMHDQNEQIGQNASMVLVQPNRLPALPEPAPDPLPVAHVACGKLSAALATARDRCKMATKDKTNEFHKYRYASADEIILTAKEALADTGLAIIPQRQKMTVIGAGNQSSYALDRTIFLSHSSGEYVPLTLEGWPVILERGKTLDKAFATALTTSMSYLLRDLLQMPRGDEQDMNARHDAPVKEKPAAKPAEPPVAPPVTDPQSPAILRNDLGKLIRDVAKAKDMEPDYVFQKLRDTLFHKFPDLPETTSGWEKPELLYAIDSLKRSMDKPAPVKPREPGIDEDEQRSDPSATGAAMPTQAAPRSANEQGQKLPQAFAANLLTMLADCGQTWPKAKDKALEWAGYSLRPEMDLRSLSLDEAGKLREWAEKKKATKAA